MPVCRLSDPPRRFNQPEVVAFRPTGIAPAPLATDFAHVEGLRGGVFDTARTAVYIFHHANVALSA